MTLKENRGSIVLIHKKNEQMSWKKCYDICKAKAQELSEDKEIEHIKAVADMLNKRIKSHAKRISLYLRMAAAIERDGLENDTTILDGGENE